MDIWREICGAEAARLESALELCKHASTLASHGTAGEWINREDVKRLNEARQAINQKLPRLKNGEFHIAVVGTEKAGKSTFINAWLGRDLLPNKPGRCTFTTTKLHSVLTDSEQRLEVTPKTMEEFNQLYATLEQESRGSDKHLAETAAEDMKNITDFRTQMEEVISEGKQVIKFEDLDEISEPLERYAADARYAHAIRQVDLYTKSLANMDGILFYDVPGINSGLSKHERETESMLKDSDAVIIVKNVERPDLDGPEKQILRFADADSSIPLKDKVFFFISQIDRELTREGFLYKQNELLENCRELNVPSDKVIFGSAPAVLLLTNNLKETKDIGSKEDLKRRLSTILDLPDQNDETILANSGIRKLRNRIDDYLKGEREKILRDSVTRLVKQVEESAVAIHNAVAKHVPDNPDDLINAHQDELAVKFEKWYDNFWKELNAKVSVDNSSNRIDLCNEKMETTYKQAAEDKLDHLRTMRPEELDKVFSARKARTQAESYETFNTDARELINNEVMGIMHDLSNGLSWDLYTQLMSYIEELSSAFNNSIDVKAELFNAMGIEREDIYKRQLEAALSALFLRLARPLAEALMLYPHGIRERKEKAKRFGTIFRSLSDTYPEDQPDKYAGLIQYLVYGKTLPSQTKNISDNLKANVETAAQQVTDKAGRGVLDKVLKKGAGATIGSMAGGIPGAVAGAMVGDVIADNVNSGNPQEEGLGHFTSRDDIIAELEDDRQALKIYLLETLFESSGIGDFAFHELNRIREKFIEDCAPAFRGLARRRYGNKDPKLMALLPAELRNTSCDTQIAEKLHQLSEALKNRNVLVN